ncbi:M56 family metallopeptidase [Mycobacteroides abscessus]|uniref:M56 family metallopeptidase n=1 Tax=Mycobacteroides abscessus TaxID=36809 RepID=UPI000308462E|nr:M56 family metallopeptidase [Mycobacteroides abscessus]CPV98205.1 Zn-dependent protease with chaperone function [Mycobacteroides abscessus]CPV98309.1 Zn-dependent protease with chaperone function [Mycobacteroides abscessus]CPV98357.1 Zn-dependent protease with chaperone function [Mycobacteroides abscessus]
MTVALVLMAGAALIGVAGPACLRPTVRPSLLPAAALAAWLGALLAFLVLTMLSATLLLFPHVLDTSGVRKLVGGCLSGTVPHSSFGTLVQLGISLLPLTILARVAVVAIRSLRSARRCRARHFWMLQAATCRSGEVHWIDDPRPIAYSLGGARGAVVATHGVRHLGERQCAAVIEHEMAHIRGRHHVAVLCADIAAAALPMLPLMRRAPAMVRLMVELAADDAAARVHGPPTVHAALLAMSQSAVAVPGVLHMSSESVAVRLLWLRTQGTAGRTPMGRARLMLGFALLPTTLAGSAVVALFRAYCTF